ncbi:MAG: pyridoxal phosphate-dependent aminotransferase [Chthonomonadales bacterium]
MHPWQMTHRSASLEPFLVMEILERAQELERAGRSILHLEVGEPDFPTPPVVAQAAQAAVAAGDTHYTHSMGLVELREAVSERYRRIYGVEVGPERILITAGSSLALFYACAALIEPGDEVLFATPHYPCYPNFIRFFGGRPMEVPTDASDGYRVDAAEVRRRITPRTRAILVNSPANPTGAVLDGERMRALADLGVPLISDEIYHGLTYEEEARTVLEFTNRAYVADGFSKRYAMTGWRLGWLVVPPGEMRVFQTMQQSFLISASPIAQRAGIAALCGGDAAVEEMRQEYSRRRGVMANLFSEIGFEIPVLPGGAFYIFAGIRRFAEDSYAFAFDLLERAGVGVAPGVDFGEAGRQAVRLSYAAGEDVIRRAAERVHGFLNRR